MSRNNYWANAPKLAYYDLACIYALSDDDRQRFYSANYARELSRKIQKRLTSDQIEEYVSELEDCANGYSPCGHYCCPTCTREYRRWIFSQLMQIINDSSKPERIVTIYLAETKKGDLKSLDLMRIRRNFYAQLRRLGFRVCHILGGIEINFDASHARWILHCHLLVLGECKNALKKLRFSLKRKVTERPIKVQLVKDCRAQISYLLKFQTYYRTGK
jgi:hypothetical protein